MFTEDAIELLGEARKRLDDARDYRGDLLTALIADGDISRVDAADALGISKARIDQLVKGRV